MIVPAPNVPKPRRDRDDAGPKSHGSIGTAGVPESVGGGPTFDGVQVLRPQGELRADASARVGGDGARLASYAVACQAMTREMRAPPVGRGRRPCYRLTASRGRPRAGRAVARRRRGGGPGGRREDGSPAGGPGQGGAAVAARLQAGAGPSLAAGVEAGRDGGRRRMRVWARFGLGLRSLRSLRPRPNRHHGRCSTRRRRRRGPVAKGDISTLDKRGHFYFALTRRQPSSTRPRASLNIDGRTQTGDKQ